ncbi:hypothetical protein G6F31_009843 [Rhizopus arrhizus]|nr:hypothetical protein G6F31_009843 [Rhizopus arrhizus]
MTALNEIHRKRFAATSSDPTGTITTDHATALTTISSETNVVSTSSPVNVSTMPIKENDTTLTQSASAPTSSSSHVILTASSSAAIMPNTSTVSIPISTRGTTRDLKRRMQQENREFVDAYRTEHGSNMDWEQCFVQGKEKGLFQQYTTAKSVKAAYFRLREGDAGSAESVEDQFESFFNKDDNIEINKILRQAIKEKKEPLYNTGKGYKEFENRTATEAMLEVVLGRLISLFKIEKNEEVKKNALKQKIEEKLYQQFRNSKKRKNTDADDSTDFNTRSRRRLRKARYQKKRLEVYKDLKNELASFHVDFADDITLFSNPELMSEFDTDSEGEGLCRKRTSYRSQEAMELVEKVHSASINQAKGKSALTISKEVAVEKDIPKDIKGKEIALPPWMLKK